MKAVPVMAVGLLLAVSAVVILDLFSTEVEGSDMEDPGWNMFRGSRNHTGQSRVDTTENNGKLVIKYQAGECIYSSPVIGHDGSIFFGKG